MNKKAGKALFTDFPAISTSAWEEKIKADLKGADYERKLMWQSGEGMKVKPYYRQEDLENLDYLSACKSLKNPSDTPNGWIIVQDIRTDSDYGKTNERILLALKGGAQALRIHLQEGRLPETGELEILLKGVHMGNTTLHFTGCLGVDSLYKSLLTLAGIQGVDPSHLQGSLGADPLGMMSTSGIQIGSLETLARMVSKTGAESSALKVIEVNGAMIQNAGSSLVEELAFSLSMASDYMAHLTDKGIDPLVAQNSMQLVLSAGSNYFMEIAKLRAARILWAKIAEGYGIEESDRRISIHSLTSEWNMTLYDPHVNMLRGTTEAMSAILGGADMLSVLPFDYPYQKDSAFSDRIARNAQIILREEAYFDRVSDPASGSYYLESLTDSIAENAWALFCEVEELGGYRLAFEKGWIQEKVEASRNEKSKKAASGRGRILGTNAFPNFNEMILDQLSGLPVHDEEDDMPANGLKPLKPFRLSSAFETLRIATEKSSKRPKVFLFKHGNPAWVTARAAFAGNFFACAGYEIVDKAPFASLEEGLEHITENNYEIVVLCSSDDAYSMLAPAVHAGIHEKSIVVVAGNPIESMDALKEAGIEHFIHVKSNLLETLTAFNNILL